MRQQRAAIHDTTRYPAAVTLVTMFLMMMLITSSIVSDGSPGPFHDRRRRCCNARDESFDFGTGRRHNIDLHFGGIDQKFGVRGRGHEGRTQRLHSSRRHRRWRNVEPAQRLYAENQTKELLFFA